MYTDFHDQNGNPVAASVVLEAIKNPIIKHSVSAGIVDGVGSAPLTFFTEEDIIRNSLIFTNSCASDGIKLGSVNIGMAKMTVSNEKFKSFREPSVLIDKLIQPIFDLDIDENTRVSVMSGDYWIKEVEQLTEGVRLTCYDSMCKLDEPFTLGTITGTPYQIFTQAATACGLTVSTTQAEMEALPNGTRTFTLHSDNDCKTWRDVLSYLSMLMGCFVTIGRHVYQVAALPGLVVRPFGNGKESFCDTVTDVHRYKGAKFSIFDTEYKAIELTAYAVDGADTIKKDFTYAETTGVTGQTIKLGYNPFIQADTPEADLTQTQRDILHELLTQVDKYAYTPMQISLPVGFIYDLGDVIKCTGGLANTGFAGGYTEDCYCCISNYTYTYGKEFRIKTLDSHAGKGRPIIVAFLSTINVTVLNGTGAIITATDGINTYTATETSGGAVLIIRAAGIYTVSAELNGTTGFLTATVEVVASGETHDATVAFVSSVLNDNSWDVISAVSKAGMASRIWGIKDYKEIRLQGTVGTISLDDTFRAAILGFDHNWEKEGKGISFGFRNKSGFSSDYLVFCDSKYDSSSTTDGTPYFNLNHWGYNNYGGWAACDMRYDILGSTDIPPLGYRADKTSDSIGYDPTDNCATNPVPNTLMSCFPADLRKVMKPITKYTGEGGYYASNVIETKDYLPIVSMFESTGNTVVNGGPIDEEYRYQKQYDYFAQGNACAWNQNGKYIRGDTIWTRSPERRTNNQFVSYGDDSSGWYYEGKYLAARSLALFPVFLV